MSIKITKEVILKKLSIADAGSIFTLIEENRAALEPYLYWANSVKSIEQTEQYIFARINSSKPGSEWFKISYRCNTVGIFGIKSVCNNGEEAEVGYWLARSAQGLGIITKTISLIGMKLKKQNLRGCPR